MKYFILSLLITLTLNSGFAQCFINKGIGGIYDDQANSIAVDNNGNIFITGSFQGTVDFNPGAGTFNLTSLNNSQNQPTKSGFLCKFDSNGNFVWAKKTDTWSPSPLGTFISTTSSSGSCEPKSLAIDNLGNLCITGNYSGFVAFNAPQIASGLIRDAGSFVWKLDNNGNFIFVKEWVAALSSTISANSICTDNSNNIWVTGCLKGTVDFSPGSTTLNEVSSTSTYNDAFIVKLTSSGSSAVFRWTFGGTYEDEGKSIAVDLSGNILVTGSFRGTVDFDITANTFNLTANGGTDIFVVKLASNGLLVKAISIGGANNDSGESIAVDLSGNVYTTGYFAYPTSGTLTTVDFDPGTSVYWLAPAGARPVYVNKFDSNLNFMWAKQAGGNGVAFAGLSLALDNLGNVYTTGFHSSTGDFDPGVNISNLNSVLPPAGSAPASYQDIFIWKLNSNGNFVWANSYGGNGEDTGLDICTDSQGNLYSVGYFSNTADFDPTNNVSNLVSNGSKDIYFQKIQPDIIPTISASGPTSFCPGGSVTLTSSSATGNTWSTGATTQSITVNSVGTYSVALSNGTCVTNSTPINVTLLTAPSEPTVSANSPTTFCSGGNVTLTSSSATGNTWSNGATTQAITVNSSGNYSVTVSNGTCSTASIPQQINVIQYPNIPTIAVNGATSFCPGGSVTLTSNNANGNTWSNGATTQSIIVNSQGSYTVSNSNGSCVSNSNPITISILNAPTLPTITASGLTSFCQGDSVVLTSSSVTGNLWSNGETTPSIVVNTSGNYDVIVSNGTCSTSSNLVQVDVISFPVIPNISVSGPTSFCPGETVTLTSSNTNGNSWSTGENSQSITVNSADSYFVSVANGSCISNSDPVTVTVFESPSVPILTQNGPLTFCQGDSVILNSSSLIDNTWSTSETTQSISVNTTGTYYVSVSNANCTSTSNPIAVDVIPLPTINSQPSNTQVNIGNQALFSVASNGDSYQWQMNNGVGFQNISNGGQFSGATTNTLTVANTTLSNNNNQFRCEITANNCSTTSNSAILTVVNNVGINEFENKNIFELYPNPSGDFVNLKSNLSLIGSKYEIIDNAGRIVLSGVLQNDNQSIDVSKLSLGIYNLNVIGSLSKTMKLVKN
jgi:hypothetical protein